MPYQHAVFLNIPVEDLDMSIAFYTAIGFRQNATFSSAEASMMTLTDDTKSATPEGPINLMLLTRPFFTTFMPPGVTIVNPKQSAQCVVCLSRSSRDHVDETAEKAVSCGGRADIRFKTEIEKQMEGMGMYSRIVSDPDGHILELMYMPAEPPKGVST